MKKQLVVTAASVILGAAVCILLIADSEKVIAASEYSITVCLSVIIPSLFAFMVLSQIMVSSGAADIIFYPLYKLSSFWFKGSSRQFSVFMLSLIGGYPVGIKLLKELIAYNKNYTAIAENMLCYCYCGSPAFIIQIAGLTVLGSSKAGLIVYFSNVLSCLTVAAAINLFSKKEAYPSANIQINAKISLKSVTDSIGAAVKALGVICGTIVAFNIFLELLDFTGVMRLLENIGAEKITAAAFEISNISVFEGKNFGLLPLFAALTSFGGLCIIMQTAALSEGKIPLKKFIIARIPTAVLSALICRFLVSVFGIAIESSAQTTPIPVWLSVNPICLICVILMTYILLKYKENKSD